MEHTHADVVQAHERLLVHRERFALADAVRTVSGSAQTLSLVQSLVQASSNKQQTSGSASAPSGNTTTNSNTSKTTATTTTGRHQHVHHALASKRLTFQDVMDAVARRAAHAEALVPAFLGYSVRV